MLNDINLWRAQIGTFSRNFKNASFTTKKSSKSTQYLFMKIFLQYFTLLFIALLSMHIIIVFYNVMNPLLSIIILAFYCQSFSISYLLLICGDIHPNPGPKDKGNLSICHCPQLYKTFIIAIF